MSLGTTETLDWRSSDLWPRMGWFLKKPTLSQYAHHLGFQFSNWKKKGQELLLRMDGEYLQFCFFRLDPIKFMNVKQSPKCSTRTHKKLVHYIGYPKHLDDWTTKQKLANQQEINHYFCSKIMSSFHFLHRAALMTGVYPFKMGLQRGFGKRSPQVSSNFVLI